MQQQQGQLVDLQGSSSSRCKGLPEQQHMAAQCPAAITQQQQQAVL
jgi:hypothetical protein